jgi:hypothetical protein
MSRWHTTDFDFLPEQAFQPRGGKGKFSGPMTMEGGGKGKAPAPDPQMGAAALRQIQLAENQFADYQQNDRPWMRGIADEALGLSRDGAALARQQFGLAQDQFGFSRDVANRQLGQSEQQLGLLRSQVDRSNSLADYQLGNMRRNDERYWNTAVPFEDQLIKDSQRFDSQAYKQGLVTQAQADVGSAFDRAGEENIRGMQRRGANPNSGAMLALGNQNSIAKATAMASAANKTRQAAEQVGLSTKMQMYGGMKGMAGLGATNAGLAAGALGGGTAALGAGAGFMNAGVGAMGAGGNALAMGNSSIGAMQGGASGMMGAGTGFLGANNAAFGSMNAGMSSGISGYGNYVGLQQNAQKINNDADPFNTILGAAAGIGTSWALGKV